VLEYFCFEFILSTTMPIKKAGVKALRQNIKHQARNRKVASDIEALVRKVRKAITAKDSTKATEWFKQVVKRVDRAYQKGILKKNTASRKKSRLAAAINALKKS